MYDWKINLNGKWKCFFSDSSCQIFFKNLRSHFSFIACEHQMNRSIGWRMDLNGRWKHLFLVPAAKQNFKMFSIQYKTRRKDLMPVFYLSFVLWTFQSGNPNFGRENTQPYTWQVTSFSRILGGMHIYIKNIYMHTILHNTPPSYNPKSVEHDTRFCLRTNSGKETFSVNDIKFYPAMYLEKILKELEKCLKKLLKHCLCFVYHSSYSVWNDQNVTKNCRKSVELCIGHLRILFANFWCNFNFAKYHRQLRHIKRFSRGINHTNTIYRTTFNLRPL